MKFKIITVLTMLSFLSISCSCIPEGEDQGDSSNNSWYESNASAGEFTFNTTTQANDIIFATFEIEE